MKRIFTLMTGLFCLGAVNAQTTGSDDPIHIKPPKNNANYVQPIGSTQGDLRVGSLTVNGTSVTTCDTGSTILVGTGACSYNWFADSAGTNLITSNDSLVTPMLTSDTTFYLQTECPDTTIGMTLPAHGNVFTGNIRGH